MDAEQVVIFRVQEEEYAVPLTDAKEIMQYQEAVKLSLAPDYLEGVIHIRGQVIPGVRLSAKFGLAGDKPAERRIIIMAVGTQEIGLVVDEVTEVINLVAANVEPTPDVCNELGACIKGIGRIGNRLIILLDIKRIFSNDELAAFQAVK